MNRAESPRLLHSRIPRITAVVLLGLTGITLSCRGDDTAPAPPTSFASTSELPTSVTLFSTTLPPSTISPDEQRQYGIAQDAVTEGIGGKFEDAERLVDTIDTRFIHTLADDALDWAETASAAEKAYSGDFEGAKTVEGLVENPAIKGQLDRVINAADQRYKSGELNSTSPAWKKVFAAGADGATALGKAAADVLRVLRARAQGIFTTTTSTTG